MISTLILSQGFAMVFKKLYLFLWQHLRSSTINFVPELLLYNVLLFAGHFLLWLLLFIVCFILFALLGALFVQSCIICRLICDCDLCRDKTGINWPMNKYFITNEFHQSLSLFSIISFYRSNQKATLSTLINIQVLI